MEQQLRILIAEARPVMRVGLRVILKEMQDVDLVGEVEDGQTALTQIEALRPDVVILSCSLPGPSVVEIAAELRQQGLPSRVMVICNETDTRHLREMTEVGVAGYILEKEESATIATAVRTVARGEQWFSPAVVTQLAASALGEQAEEATLTERELVVLGLIAQGWTNAHIAQEMNLSERTVAFHIENLLNKLDASNRTEAAVQATRLGLI